MNTLQVVQTEGYPLKSERLKEIETAYKIFNSFGDLAGNLTIISGCETIGSYVSDGYVYIDGELLEFRQAAVNESSTVVIVEETTNREFKTGAVKNVYTIRYATFGTATTSWPWANFKALDPIVTLMTRLQTVETKLATVAEGADKTILKKVSVTLNPAAGSSGATNSIVFGTELETSNYIVLPAINYTSGSVSNPEVSCITKSHTASGFFYTMKWESTVNKQFVVDFVIISKD